MWPAACQNTCWTSIRPAFYTGHVILTANAPRQKPHMLLNWHENKMNYFLLSNLVATLISILQFHWLPGSVTNHKLSNSYLYSPSFCEDMVQQLLKCLASLAALHWKSYFLINRVSRYSWLTSSKSDNPMFHVLGLTLPFPVLLITECKWILTVWQVKITILFQMRKWPRVDCDSPGSLDLFSELFTANCPDLRFWLIISSLKSKPQDPSPVKSPLLLPLIGWDHFAEFPEVPHISVH